jgi:hypothetical protein
MAPKKKARKRARKSTRKKARRSRPTKRSAAVAAAPTPPQWPVETRATMDAFYGAHTLKADGMPTDAWTKANLVVIQAPYPMVPSWMPTAVVTRIQCHRLVAQSLKRILQGILDHYGSIERVRGARMHLFGGVYNFRRISGSANLSTHAYGAGIDLDPDNNPLGKEWAPDSGMIPMEVVEIFEREGWKWGGRFRNRKDCMHFQATS